MVPSVGGLEQRLGIYHVLSGAVLVLLMSCLMLSCRFFSFVELLSLRFHLLFNIISISTTWFIKKTSMPEVISFALHCKHGRGPPSRTCLVTSHAATPLILDYSGSSLICLPIGYPYRLWRYPCDLRMDNLDTGDYFACYGVRVTLFATQRHHLSSWLSSPSHSLCHKK